MTSFAALVQDYVRLKGFVDTQTPPGRMIAVVGDAEFDEGNVFEALLEGWKHKVGNLWWVIDYNRQSLDAIVEDRIFQRLDAIFRDMEWRVVTLKYGSLLERAFTHRGGDALRRWIDECPNAHYSAYAYQGGRAWRERLVADLGDTSGIKALLDEHDDSALQRLMTNLGGHDLQTVREAFHAVDDDQPTAFIAYTIKGHRLPFEGHKDNHSGLMSPDQMDAFRRSLGIAEGEEWDRFAGLDVPADELETFLDALPFSQPAERRHRAPRIAVPDTLRSPVAERMSAQEGFGRLLAHIARQHPDLADRLGLSDSLFGARLLPIGTLYDSFVTRGLDALNYACYQDARFMVVGTPAGISLAPEGGAHQSVVTSLIGLGQPGLTSFEPAYVDDLAEILRWSLAHIQAADGGSVYLRLSTRPIAQPTRDRTAADRAEVIAGGYWLVPPALGASLAIVCCGPVVHEALEAHGQLREDLPGAGLLVVTSAAQLQRGWKRRQLAAAGVAPSHVARLLAPLAKDAGLVIVIDGHPAGLSWLGAVRGQRVLSPGVERFGQSGDIQDLYRTYGIDAAAIVDAAARLLVPRSG